MSIFQSIVVLWHFIFQFVHHHILERTPFSESIKPFVHIHSPFDLVVDPYELHTGAYPPSLGSSDLSLASLSFDLVVDPYELSY